MNRCRCLLFIRHLLLKTADLSERGEALPEVMETSDLVMERTLPHPPSQEIMEPGQQSARWYAICTRPRHEKKVHEFLRYRQMESFLPLYRAIHRWKNGCKAQVELPVFPGYLFVKIRGYEWLRALDTPGVLSFVGTRQRPSQLDDFEIETLKSGLHLHRFEPHSRLTVGERVRIIAGPLSGLGGILLRNKNGIRVVITLELIHQSVAVELDVDDVEPLASCVPDVCEKAKN